MILQNRTDIVIKTSKNLFKSAFISKLPVFESFERKLAFTLAEVLITLLIIGVVASLVIPALINNTQEAEYNTGLKKVYAELSNAVRMIQANGDTLPVGSGNTIIDGKAFRDQLCNVMVCTKKGLESLVFGGITYNYYKAGQFAIFNNYYDAAAALNDGTLLVFFTYNGCDNRGVNACGYFYVDINGLKKPNMLGKDLYLIYVTRKNGFYSVLPLGTPEDTVFSASKTCIMGDGHGCAAVRLTNPDAMP